MSEQKQEIPKVIHYFWFGGKPLPKLVEKCIESWKKYLPDYEIKRWDESNFDVNIIPYTRDAYKEKKYAFVSDYARFWVLYNYGGLYFDTDVEIIKPLYHIVEGGGFMGQHKDYGKGIKVNPGLCLGSSPKNAFYREMLDFYNTLSFYHSDGSLNLETVVTYTTEALKRHGLQNSPTLQKISNINIYPGEYFDPKSVIDGEITKTEQTVAIHHFAGSWLSKSQKLYVLIRNIAGYRIAQFISRLAKSLTK